MATHTVPDGTPSDGPGPATPVVAIAHVAPNFARTACAIATATSWL